MQFRVLGPLEVAAGDHRAAVARGRQRTILGVLLAAGGETVTTERLIDAVWGPEPPRSARKSLQSHLSRLRGHLLEVAGDAPAPLVAASDGYRMDLEAHELDAWRFAGLVEQARSARDADPDLALELLEQADACWYGPAFGELASHPAVQAEAQRLEQLRAAAAADRIDAWLARGRLEEALAELQPAVGTDPFDERAVALLMRALVLAGRQADALTMFRDLQTRLRDDLGVDPSPPLRRLHEDILRQDPSTAPPARRRPPGVARGHGDRLLGRDRDVETLTDWVTTSPLVTLTGPGGVGKTRLAERVVHEVADRFLDGVVVCALAHVRDAAGVGGALITALGIQPTGERSVSETLVSALGDRRLLLLLDNCEHVLEAVAPPVEAVLARCPNVAVLATSRERLRLPGEHVWPVTPLDVPPAGARLNEVVATSAGALFRLRAQAVDPTFDLAEEEGPAVAELCRRLDGMPLALELAAARTRALAPGDLVERPDQRFAVLAGGPRHEAGRHRTLEAVVAWSYELLAPAEATLFARLSVFAGAFPLDAAEQVCAEGDVTAIDVAGLLGELVDKSMVVVQRTGQDVRYRLLDTMRDFGTRRLDETGTSERLRRRHADHYLALTEDRGAQVRGPDEQEAVAAIDAAIDDLRAAHAWLVAIGDVDGALRLPAALGDYTLFRLRDEVTTWARRALELPGAAEHPARPGALATAAMGATSRDECRRADREGTEALDRAGADGLVRVLALSALVTVELYEGRLDDVLRQADDLEAAAGRLDDSYHGAFAGVCRVLGHLYRGEQHAAVAHAAELRRTAEASGNPTMRAFARYCTGEVHLDVQPDAAAASLEEAVDLARSVSNQLIEGVSLVCLASLRGRRGRTREALRLFRDVVAHWRRLGDHTHQLTALRNLVELLAAIEADEAAAVLYGAVTAGGTPSFGVEAERLAAAWQRVERRLGREAAARLAADGRQLGARRMGDEAITRLDALLQG